MIANRKSLRPYVAVVAVGLFVSSTLFAVADEVSTAGVRLLAGSAVVSIDVSCAAEATICPKGLAPGSVARQTSVRGINPRGGHWPARF